MVWMCIIWFKFFVLFVVEGIELDVIRKYSEVVFDIVIFDDFERWV